MVAISNLRLSEIPGLCLACTRCTAVQRGARRAIKATASIEQFSQALFGMVGIIMRAGLYNGRDGLDMMVSDKAYQLTPVGLVENGEDFDWARFKVTQQGA